MLNDIETSIKKNLEEQKYSELAKNFNQFQMEIKKLTKYKQEYGTPYSFLRTIRKLEEFLFKEKKDLDQELTTKTGKQGVIILKQKIKKLAVTYRLEIERAIIENRIDENEVSDYEE